MYKIVYIGGGPTPFLYMATRFLPNVHVQKCTKYVFSCLEVPWIDLLAVANLQWQVHHMGMYLITLTPFLLFLTGGQKLSYLVSRVLDLKDTATLQFTNLLFNYRSGILSEN